MNLDSFYAMAKNRGFTNNSSKKNLIDSLYREREHIVYVLFYKDTPVGTIGAHNFDELGQNCYRIAARTCVLTNLIPTPKWFTNKRTLGTLNGLSTHQHVTSQFLLPACIDWAPSESKLYITTNTDDTGKQKSVHTVYAPLMQSKGILKFEKELDYRGSIQSVWAFDKIKFYEDLEKYPRWSLNME